jgi:hypothetical protein
LPPFRLQNGAGGFPSRMSRLGWELGYLGCEYDTWPKWTICVRHHSHTEGVREEKYAEHFLGPVSHQDIVDMRSFSVMLRPLDLKSVGLLDQVPFGWLRGLSSTSSSRCRLLPRPPVLRPQGRLAHLHCAYAWLRLCTDCLCIKSIVVSRADGQSHSLCDQVGNQS